MAYFSLIVGFATNNKENHPTTLKLHPFYNSFDDRAFRLLPDFGASAGFRRTLHATKDCNHPAEELDFFKEWHMTNRKANP